MTEFKTLPQTTEQGRNLAPQAPFLSLRREINRLFEDFNDDLFRPRAFGRAWLEPFSYSRNSINMPAVDVTEQDRAFEISAEMPGIEEKDIEVTLSKDGLLIRGEKKAESAKKEQGHYLSERSYGSFERYFHLPDSVAADRISASFKNGVLTVILPKTEKAQSTEKKIPVKAA